ncbi:MAG: T9SS type A sorting domain-containing protein [Bacteroidota bacterium]
MIPASEIYSAGGGPGLINSIAFNVSTIQGTALQGFEIKMGTTTANSTTTTFTTGLTTVYSTTSYTEFTGWNTHTFATPFFWDGASNIVVQICFNNGSYTGNAVVFQTTTTYNSSVNYHADATGVCSIATGSTTYLQRPNMRLDIIPINIAANLGVLPWSQSTVYCNLPATVPIPISIKNWGTDPQSNYNVSYSIDGGTNWVTETVTSVINPDDTLDYVFSIYANMATPGTYHCMLAVSLAGDTMSYNDTISIDIFNHLKINLFPFIEDFESGTSDYFNITNNGNSNAYIYNDGSSYILRMEGKNPGGWTGGSTTTTPTNAWNDNTTHHSFAMTCDIDATSMTTLELLIDLKQYYSSYGNKYSWFRVLINGTQISDIFGQSDFNPVTIDSDPWKTLRFDIQPYAGTIFTLTLQSSNYYDKIYSMPGDNAFVDNIIIREKQPDDAGIDQLISQVNGCGVSSAEEISIRLKNYGNNQLTGFDVGYKVDAGSPVVENIGAVTINPGNTFDYTFSTLADISIAGNHTIKVWTGLTGDTFIANDTLVEVVTLQPYVVVYPYDEDFETFTVGSPGTLMNGWTRNPASAYTWYVDNAGTSSSGTGPNVDHTLGTSVGKYLYVEASNGSAGNLAELISPCLDLSSMTAPRLKFWYHMYGASIDTLYVDVLVGGTWINDIFYIGGQQQISNADVWKEAVVDFSSYNTLDHFRFRAKRGTSFEGDISLDDINIFEPLQDNLAVTNLIEPVPTGCAMSSSEIVIVEIINEGQNDATNFDLSFSIDSGLTYTTPETYTSILLSGDTLEYTFTATADMSVPGDYDFVVVIDYTADQFSPNDTLYYTIHIDTSITVYPFNEKFETFIVGVPGTLANGWTRIPTTGYIWYVDNGGTPSSSTGPSVDHTLGTTVGKYMYIETDNGLVGGKAYLISPCLDISGMSAPILSFWYHMYGALIDTLYVDALVGGVWIEGIYEIGGQQQISNADVWKQALVNMTGYNNADKIRFRIEKIGCCTGDAAIDDINIDQAPDFDIAVNAWYSPVAGCGLTANESISVQLVNMGASPQDTIFLGYSFDDGTTVISEYYYPEILPGDTVIYTFTQQADMSALITYNCFAAIMDTNDINQINDTAWIVITNVPMISSYPYFENFEGSSYWNSGGTNSSWALGTPAGTTINGAGSGSNSWMTNLNTYYNNSEASWVIGPCFDFSTLSAPIFEMKAWWNSELSYDGAVIQYSLNGGSTWITIGVFGDPNNWYSYNSVYGVFTMTGGYDAWAGTGIGDWVTVKHDLNMLAGMSDVKLRIAFASDGSANSYDGFAFDDILIYETPDNDLTVLSWDNPVSSECGMGIEDIEIAVFNAGTQAQSNFDLSYSVDGGTSWITETYVASINPGDTLHYTFLTQADFSVAGIYNCLAVVTNPGDVFSFNDTLNYSVTSLITISTFPYFQNFESVNYWTTGGINGTWALGTPAGITIIGAASGSNSWMTNLTGVYNNSDASWVVGPCFDFSSLSAPIFEMKAWWNTELNYDGSVLQYSLDGGVTWITVGAFGDPYNWYSYNSVYGIYTMTGAYDAWAGNTMTEWVTVKHELTGLGGISDVKLRIVFASDGSVTYDGFAFDDVFIYDTPNYDLAVTSWNSPLDACPSASEIVNITIENLGLDDQTNVPVSYSIDDGLTWIPNEIITATIPSGGTYVYSFITPADFSTIGVYNCRAAIMDPADELHFNDTIDISIDIFAIQTLPFVEDFELATVGAPGILPNHWTTTSNSTYRWHVRNSSTPTINTGPSNDHTTGVFGGKYVYTEADNGIVNDTAYLYLPCVDIASYTNPSLTFWYHMYGTNINKLTVDVFSGSVWVNDIYTITGQQQTSSTSAWLYAQVDLTSYLDATEIRFRGIKGSGTLGDIALDDINIFEPFEDVGVTEISSPNTSCVLYSLMNITVKIQNFGTITYMTGDTIMVGLEFNGTPQVIEPFILPSNFTPGTSKFFIFPGYFDLSVPGNYNIISYTIESGDIDNYNDTTAKTVSHYGNPILSLGADIITIMPDTVILDAGSWTSYIWTGGTTTQTFDVDTAGYYSVTITDSNGCTASDQIYVGNSVSLSQSSSFTGLMIFPNPNDGIFTISYEADVISEFIIEIIDIQGQLLYQEKISNIRKLNKDIDLRSFAAGIYYIKLSDGENIYIEKLIIK